MAVKSININDNSSGTTRSLSGTTTLPLKAKIISVTSAGVEATKITHTYNETTGVISVTLNSVPYTRRSTQTISHPFSGRGGAADGNSWNCYYSGTSQVVNVGSGVSCPSSVSSQSYTYYFEYEIVITYETNSIPTLTLETTDNRTLYENDTFNLTGSYNDPDSGNVISVKYSVNNGVARALTSAISDGIAKTFNRVLTYKNNKLFDGATSVTDTLAEGVQHVVKVWAEDDKGGKSQEQMRTFYVVANRAPVLTINVFPATPNLLNTGTVKFTGTVADPDGNTVKVEYKVGSASYAEVYSGNGGDFEITIPLSNLNVGKNGVSIRAVDSYGATTQRNLEVTKAAASTPLKESVKCYRITAPNGSAQGVFLWVQRESGDLTVSAEISMTAAGEPENFVPMTKNSTAFVNGSVEEDEFAYEDTEAKNNIVVKLKMTRQNPASTAGIILVNGVLS